MTTATLSPAPAASTCAPRPDRQAAVAVRAGIRLYLARVFIASALTKIQDWNITLALFENEYHVPVLSPAAAALLGTAAEFGLPLLLLAGFGTRLAALALFAFNVVAVISYPDLSDAGLKDHILWGALMLVLAVYGRARSPSTLARPGLTASAGGPVGRAYFSASKRLFARASPRAVSVADLRIVQVESASASTIAAATRGA